MDQYSAALRLCQCFLAWKNPKMAVSSSAQQASSLDGVHLVLVEEVEIAAAWAAVQLSGSTLASNNVTARTNQPLGDAYCRSPRDTKCSDEQNEERHQPERRKLVVNQAADQEAGELNTDQSQNIRNHEGERLHGISSVA